MYTFNYFCFGHDLSVDKNLNNTLNEYDVEFFLSINKKDWQVDFPYHGGQINGDCYSCIFGTVIASDDNNRNYINKIRNAKEEDYINDYNEFLTKLFIDLESDAQGEYENEMKLLIFQLKTFIKKHKPGFYSVEASS